MRLDLGKMSLALEPRHVTSKGLPPIDADLAFFLTFETGGLEDPFATFGAPSVQSSVVYAGSHALHMAPAATRAQVFYRRTGVLDFGDGISPHEAEFVNGVVFGFHVRFDDVTPGADRIFTYILSTTGNYMATGLILKSDGTLGLRGKDNTSEVGSGAPGFINNTWHLLQVYFERGTSSPAVVKVDDTEVISVTGQDFQSKPDGLNANVGSIALSGMNLTEGSNVYFDNVFVFDNAAGPEVLA